jgi:hypothetical protein
MSAVKHFTSWLEADAELQQLKVDWPAAKIVSDDKFYKAWRIAGDYACTKFLHEDGHVY